MTRKSWFFHFMKSLRAYKNSGDKYIGQEANGNLYFERTLDEKLKRYVINPKDLDIPRKNQFNLKSFKWFAGRPKN